MAWDVRPTRDLEEFRRAVGAIGHYFGGWPADEEAAQRFASNLPLERMHAAFDGDRIVGGAGAFPFELTVPGGPVRCGGVTVVGVLPTHRRRGVLTAMMRAQLEDIRERGEPIAALWASEEVIYRRFGYGLASLSGEIERCPAATRACASHPTTGRPHVSLRSTSRRTCSPRSTSVSGSARRACSHRTDDVVGDCATCPTRRIAGRAAARRTRSSSSSTASLPATRSTASTRSSKRGAAAGHVDVIEAVADGPVATRELWRVLLDMDWKATLKASLLPIDHPLRAPARLPPADAVACRRRALGAARRRRRGALGARLRRRRAGRARGGGPVPARERGPLADRRRHRRAHRRRRRSRRSTWASSALPTSAASRSRSSCGRASCAN